jgi:hypothetical protein
MSDKNNNFDDLKKLLKLKRHEIPPPGYFNNFSGDVIGRIRAGESGGPASLFEQLQSDSPLLATLLSIFHARPGIVGGLATSVCLLLLVSVLIADHSDQAAPDMPQGFAQAAQPSDSVADNNQASSPAPGASLAVASGGGISVSSNPVVSLQPVATLFGAQQNPLFQPVGFAPATQNQ